jgi:hypothetical protein
VSAVRVVLEGGLGNQLFGWAAGYALAQKRGAQLILDGSNLHQWGYQLSQINTRATLIRSSRVWHVPGIHSLLRWMRPLDSRAFGKVFWEKGFEYQPSVEQLATPLTLRGFFQSNRYFTAAEEDIQNIVLSSSAWQNSKKILETYDIPREFIAVNVRLGDYLSVSDHFAQLSADYFNKGIARARENVGRIPVVIFSDSIAICKEMLPGHSFYVGMQQGHTFLEKMLAIAHGKALVGANSSFSWWAAFLSPSEDKNKFFPRQWFADPTIDTNDLIPSGWHRLDINPAAS